MKTQIYKALTKEGHPIITVIATSPDEAREKIEEQLNRPGRYGYLQQWIEGGKRVEVRR